ncbi:MAG: alpha-L-fucosidase, partial [Candidatus Omnitrophica bacterium]|nr:alpha-L-fucosidase [Candidatus Omnitrophota bacterium]
VSMAVEKRIQAITNAELVFKTANEQTQPEVDDLMESPEWEYLLREIMMAIFYGKSIIELDFSTGFSCYSIPRQHINAQNRIIAINPTDETGIPYTDDDFLLNVGPTGRGEFDERAVSRLEGIGNWMRRHSRSIYGCTQAPAEFTAPANCRLTYNPKTNCLYVHILAWPFRHLHLDGYGQRVEYAQLLHDASEVKIDRNQKKPEDITLELPVVKPNVTIPVVELFLK